MRVFGVVLAGVLALTTPIAAHSASLGSNIGQARTGPAPGVVRVGDAHSPNWHPAPGGGAGGWHPVPGHVREWQGGWVPPRWGPNRYYGGWGPYGAPGVPTYWVWGLGGGAFDYPFADWRGPDGGWGNP